jgi:hypothetical protein
VTRETLFWKIQVQHRTDASRLENVHVCPQSNANNAKMMHYTEKVLLVDY